MFNTYEELMGAVEERRNDVLTLEIDLGSTYSQEHEDAKKALKQAEAMKSLAGEQQFLNDNIAAAEQRVADTKPAARIAYLQFRRVPLKEWTLLLKTASSGSMTAVEQYEKVLPATFIGVFGRDPIKPEDWNDEDQGTWEAPDALTSDPSVLSSVSDRCILPGAQLNAVVNTFMAWQNSSGDVNIRPTKSGLV